MIYLIKAIKIIKKLGIWYKYHLLENKVKDKNKEIKF